MSLLVHPDKNQDDAERAQKAFDGKYYYGLSVSNCTHLRVQHFGVLFSAVTKAFKTLEDNESYRKCLEVVQEAKDRVIKMVVMNYFHTATNRLQRRELKLRDRPLMRMILQK